MRFYSTFCSKKLLFIFPFFVIMQVGFSQISIPVIHANSKVVSILDGDHYRKNWWYIMPEKQPDFYEVENAKKQHKVTFYTHVDSISFYVSYNQKYPFVIILNHKDSCFTTLTTVPPNPLPFFRACKNCESINDTIPFNLKIDNKTYIKAQVNNTNPLTFQFDLGTTACILKENMNNNCAVVWNGTAEMGSVSGNSKVKQSTTNKVKIGNIQWDSVSIFSTKHTNWGSKGIIGNSLFQNDILELNYNDNILVLHRTLPIIANDYVKLELQIRDGVPYLPITIDDGITKVTNWFVYDNGFDDCMLLDNQFAKNNNFYSTMKALGHKNNSNNGKTKTVEASKLFLGNFELSNVPIDLQNPNDKNPYDRMIIGNDILKRFNAIIDYKNNVIYLKPNIHINEKYNKANNLKKKIVITIGALVVGAVGFLIYKKIKK